MSNDKTELEFGGATITGGKLLLIIPFLGAVGGAMWGGFEVYQRLLDAEEAVINTLPPTFRPMTRHWRCCNHGLPTKTGY